MKLFGDIDDTNNVLGWFCCKIFAPMFFWFFVVYSIMELFRPV